MFTVVNLEYIYDSWLEMPSAYPFIPHKKGPQQQINNKDLMACWRESARVHWGSGEAPVVIGISGGYPLQPYLIGSVLRTPIATAETYSAYYRKIYSPCKPWVQFEELSGIHTVALPQISSTRSTCPTPYPPTVSQTATAQWHHETRATSGVCPALGTSSHCISPTLGLHLYSTKLIEVAEPQLWGARAQDWPWLWSYIEGKPTPHYHHTCSWRNSLAVLPRVNLPLSWPNCCMPSSKQKRLSGLHAVDIPPASRMAMCPHSGPEKQPCSILYPETGPWPSRQPCTQNQGLRSSPAGHHWWAYIPT